MEKQETRPVVTGEEGGPISFEQAVSWTANHRLRHPNDTVSQFFGEKILNTILQQDGCKGIRIYYANSQKLSGWQKFWIGVGNFFIKAVANAQGEKKFIIVGVTETGEDQLPGDAHNDVATASTTIKTFKLSAAAPRQVTIGDQSYPCPGSAGCPKGKLSGTGSD